MAYTDYLDTVQKVYIGYYQRAADPGGLIYWAAKLDAKGGNLNEIIEAFANEPESQALYGTINSSNISTVVDSIYNALFGRDAEPGAGGLDFWVNGFNAGTFTAATIMLNILNAAQNEDRLAVENKLAAANLFTETIDPGLDGRDLTAMYSGPDDAAAARAWLADVTWNPLSVPNQTETTAFVQDSIADPGDPILPPPVVGLDFMLTADQDILVGNVGDDVFSADVVQVAGPQVNSLATGDNLNGGAGADVLEAQVTKGLYMGGGNMPIMPRTTGIEEVKFEALNSDIGSDTDVYVNAKHMADVVNIGSWYSDANLIIQDLTTLNAAGGTRPLSDMTVTMDHTGNDDSRWDESDLSVYFDQDYLNPDQLNQSQANWWLLDEDAEMEGLSARLEHIDSDGLIFEVDGVQVILRDYQNVVPGAGTHETFVANLQDELQALIAAGIVPADTTLTLDYNLTDRTFMDNGAQSADIPAMVLHTNTDVVLVATGFSHPPDLTGQYDVYGRFDSEAGESQRLSINVDLEKVGRAGEGGDLVIGSMSKDPGNHWNDDMAGRGIDAFDVTVFGGVAESSSLASLSSTNNTLREVNVTTDPLNTSGDYANLTIGNSNTSEHGYALKDVQTFNSTTFLGDVTLTADLTGEVVSKYMNLGDVDVDPAADNIAFNYSTGIGNDTIDMVISADNLANDFFDNNVGTTTREDFNLNISTADGDDKVTLSIDGDALDYRGPNGNGGPYYEHWYVNSKLNANLNINTGDGNDTISKPGSGDVIMNAGSGDDIVYADNSGTYPITDRMATFVFNVDSDNSNDRSLQNLESDVNDTGYRIFNGELTVTFKGFESTVDLLNTQGKVSDLQVNQSIKDAINNDDVLSSFLVAKDGPANTLVVESLIDGVMAEEDLAIALKAPTALTAGEVNTLRTAYNLPAATSAQLIALMTADIAAFGVKGDYDTAFATYFGGPDYEGVDSYAVSDNTITPGLGNDDIVLGTGMFSNDTVVYDGFGNGNDAIVNFDTTWYDEEKILIVPPVEVYEQVTLTFTLSDGSPAAETIIFDGVTVNLSAPVVMGVIPAFDVAYQFSEQFDSANWGVDHTVGTAVVTLTAKTPGDVTDVVAADFTGTYLDPIATGGGGTVTPAVITQGDINYNDGTASTFTVVFDTPGTAADAPGSFVFDTVTVNYVAGDGSITLAAALATGVFPNWTDVDNGDGSVTFTALANDDTPIGTDVIFKVDAGTPDDGIIGTVSGTVGTPDTTEPLYVIIPAGPGPGLDYLDFTAYNVQAVAVNGTEFDFGTMPLATDTGKYITMVESATNDGFYTISLVDFGATSATADNVSDQLIGVADFGVEKAFVLANFIV